MAEALPRAVLDTNVWISAFLNPAGPPAQIVDAFFQGRIVPVIAPPLLDEIEEIFHRLRTRRRRPLDEQALVVVLTALRERAIKVHPAGQLRLCRDPNDDFLLEPVMHFQVGRCYPSR